MSALWRPDLDVPLRFLRTAYEHDDWIAVFLKSYETARTQQRIVPVPLAADPRFQAWLRAENAGGSNVYVSVNAVTPHRRSRTRDAVRHVRHVFLDADRDAARVLALIAARRDLPAPSFVIHSSVDRVHVLWRVARLGCNAVEALQKRLANELGTDPAATSCTQLTRLPGFLNHKRLPAHVVSIDYSDMDRAYRPSDFPGTIRDVNVQPHAPARSHATNAVQRARRYLRATPAAVAGQHGDIHTFRVCCRLVRGFALADDDAFQLLVDWNARCQPPWSERELRDKLRHARRYGREPVAGLLEAQS